MLALAAPASAANITVSSTCSLPNAITAANTNTATGGCIAGDDGEPGDEDIITITATPGVANVITLSAALPQVTSKIRILGSGGYVSIDGDDSYRVFSVGSGGELRLGSLSIDNGSAATGGGMRVELGGIAVLFNVQFFDNVASGSGGSGGGAIHNAGTTTIINGYFVRNSAPWGGAIDNAGTLRVYRSFISYSDASGYGSAFMMQYTGVALIQNSIIINSTGPSAIKLLDTSDTTITHSSIENNAGHGISVGWSGEGHTPTLKLRNSALSYLTDTNCEVVSGSITENIGNFIEDGTCSPAFRGLVQQNYPDGYIDLVPCISGVDVDYYGNSRPQGNACDPGAVEWVLSSAPPKATQAPQPKATKKPDKESDRLRKELKEEHNIDIWSDQIGSVYGKHYSGSQLQWNQPNDPLGIPPILEAVALSGTINSSNPTKICFDEESGFIAIVKNGVPETVHALSTCRSKDGSMTCAEATFPGTVLLFPNAQTAADWHYQIGGTSYQSHTCLRGLLPEATDEPTKEPTHTIIVATPGPDGSIWHTVREGDSLSAIAFAYNVEPAVISTLNSLPNGNIISVGQKLKIREATGDAGEGGGGGDEVIEVDTVNGRVKLKRVYDEGIRNPVVRDRIGYTHAIEVSGDAASGALICLPGNGRLVLIKKEQSLADQTVTVPTISEDNAGIGHKCGLVQEPGTLVMLEENQDAEGMYATLVFARPSLEVVKWAVLTKLAAVEGAVGIVTCIFDVAWGLWETYDLFKERDRDSSADSAEIAVAATKLFTQFLACGGNAVVEVIVTVWGFLEAAWNVGLDDIVGQGHLLYRIMRGDLDVTWW